MSDDNKNGKLEHLKLAGFKVYGYTSQSPIIRDPEELFNSPEVAISDFMEPVIMGRLLASGAHDADWTEREVTLRREYIEENITFRERNKWELLAEHHRDFYAKSACDLRHIVDGMRSLERKDDKSLRQWYSGITAKRDVALNMKVSSVANMVFPVPCCEGIRNGLKYALVAMVKYYGLPASGECVTACKELGDAELNDNIGKISKGVSIQLADAMSLMDSDCNIHGVKDCLGVWASYFDARSTNKKEAKKPPSKKRPSTIEKNKIIEVYEKVVRSSAGHKSDNELINEVAELVKRSPATVRRALKLID